MPQALGVHTGFPGRGERGGEGYLSQLSWYFPLTLVQKRSLELVQQCCPRAGQGGTGPVQPPELQAALLRVAWEDS